MPETLVYRPGGQIAIESRPPQALQPDEVRLQTRMTAVRHGLDAWLLGGLCEEPAPGSAILPCGWGVGEVLETGAAVESIAPGEQVQGYLRHCSEQVMPAQQLFTLQWLRPEFAVFADAGARALMAVDAACVRYGHSVAICGMGAVGLMAVQYALLSGARQVICLDENQNRLRIAQRLGAHEIFPCRASDAPVRLQQRADAVIDCAGSAETLERGGAWLRESGALVAAGCGYAPEAWNRLQAERPGHLVALGAPSLHPEPRLMQRVIQSLASGEVIVWPLISHIIAFGDAPAVIPRLAADQERYIKVLLSFE